MNFESLDLSARVLDISEFNEILNYENLRLQQSGRGDDITASWNAPWRQEALEHYLPKGWCFALRNNDGQLKAYFLAQPLIFFRGMTQTLWVEYMAYENQNELLALVDLGRRYAKDKHFQKVIFNTNVDLTEWGAQATMTDTFEFNTTRMS